MAKGDDALARKKNKSTRKKLNRKNDSATVSARIASIIAAKKRRKSGKRSMCQGMCFSLPTPEDPFNERPSKVEKKKKEKKKVKKTYKEEGKKPIVDEKIDGPPKFLMSCLNTIESSFRSDDIYSHDQLDKSLFASSWGFEFWKSVSSGKDVLETSGTSSTIEQIAWIVSTATEFIARREKDEQGDSLGNSPFLLYLVPSQSKASQVRSICKALKTLGIHTVSLHQGTSLDHQITGLKSCEPEFLVSTPERLLEIVALKGVDISGVSMLVIDELGSLCTDGYLDAVKSIKQAISNKHRSIVFNDSFSASHIPAVKSLLKGSISRVSLSDSVASQGACITQTVNICSSEEQKLHKFADILDSSSSKIIHIITKEESFRKLKAVLKLKGHSVSDSKTSELRKSRKPLVRLIDIEELDTTVMREYETVLLPEFVPSIETYSQILTSMARESVNGVLQSFLTEDEAASYEAGPLVNVLEECGQNVPEPWRDLSDDMSD